jgi:hypothetical protein
MCADLVELDVLGADDAPYVLRDAAHARCAMDGGSLAIVHFLYSTGDKPALREQTGRELLDNAESVAYRRRGPIGDTLNMKQEQKDLE